MNSDTRFCSDCSTTKPAGEFYRIGPGKRYFSSYCKGCVRDRSRRYETQAGRQTSNRAYNERLRGSAWGRAKLILWAMQARTRTAGYEPVEFTRAEIADVIEGGSCVRSGIPFVLTHEGGSRYGPFSPSPDRIDPRRGYTKSNVQWVCAIYNLMKNEWTDADVRRFAQALVDNQFGDIP